jgi:hypothetical protein
MANPDERGGRGRITSAARLRGAKAKAERGLFNRYIRALNGRQAQRTRDKLTDVEATLARGTRTKRAPVFENGKRIATVDKLLPLLPSEHAELLVKRDRLRCAVQAVVPPALRAEFLAMLPDYAARHGFTREILLEVGVPALDLDEIGLLALG